MGDHHIGQICSLAPPGPEGHWPHPAIRNLIERLSSEDFEAGITNGLLNGRGFFKKAMNEGGVQERAIATRYRQNADALGIAHPRTARLLSRMAESYDRHAEHEDQRAQQRDLE